MTVTVHQTLHGYNNGHQLLASSLQLEPTDEKLLLFQSDLSGPTLVRGFESYISGFPLKSGNYYAFSRTWYADEMRRPGCVWTHTILIGYADLGRLINLRQLMDIFRRPENEKFQSYRRQVDIADSDTDLSIVEVDQELKQGIATALYEQPDNCILVPGAASSDFEEILVSIWSDQWPRLRRNFLFCSGSLSLRTFDKKMFDLQVVPNKLVNQIKKQAEQIAIFTSEIEVNPLIAAVRPRSNKLLTGLTWLVGSDVEGTRSNYFRLLEVVSLLSKTSSIAAVSDLMLKLFPKQSEAVVFKSRLFGKASGRTFNITEFELLQYLLFTPEKQLSFLSLDTLALDVRMKELLTEEQITVMQFAELWFNAQPGRISDNIWDDVQLSTENALLLSTAYPDLSLILIRLYPLMGTYVAFWQLPSKHQLRAIKLLSDHIKSEDGIKYLKALVSAKSDVFVDALRHVGISYLPTFLIAYVHSKNNDPTYLQPVLSEYYPEFRTWIKKQKSSDIPQKLFEAIFISLNIEKLQRLDLSSQVWVYGYKSVVGNESKVHKVFAACIVLSIGFLNRIDDSEQLVTETFNTVFDFGLRGQLGTGIWQMINRDDYHYHDEPESVGFWSMFIRKKKDRVPSWDYCESLVRIGSNAFVKNEWRTQSFVATFFEPKVFERVIDYLLTYNKGEKYVARIVTEITNGKLRISKIQKDILKNAYE